MPDTLWGCPKDAKGYDYDLAKAKDYMAKAIAEGAPMKRPVELHVQSENEHPCRPRNCSRAIWPRSAST